MLTEIEWWGGLLFIWMAVSAGALYSVCIKKSEFEIWILLEVVSFIAAAVILALFFYKLDHVVMRYIFLGFLGLGTLTTVLGFFAPDTDDEDLDDEGLDEEEEDEEDIGAFYSILGQVVYLFPLLVSFLLAYFKCYQLIDTFA